MSKLALLGGKAAVAAAASPDMFQWPIVTSEMEAAVLEVLRAGNMSGTDITKQFEDEYAAWHGSKYALAHSSGTAALQAAMFGVGLGPGDEMICPSMTYWASAMPALSLGASVVFADIDPETVCLCPKSFEARITPRTKAVVVVHYASMPADMDRIMAIARKHGIKVIEDVSHAQGGLYKGRMLGTFGDVAACSLMSGKSFAIGEGGMLHTDNLEVYERAILWGHYERHGQVREETKAGAGGLPWGGYKYRMHQLSSVVGREQLKKYPGEIAEIDQAMKYFWSLLEGLPGIKCCYPKDEGSSKSGWYASHAFYDSSALQGLSIRRFVEAVQAEGVAGCRAGGNRPLHNHPLFSSFDIYGHGKPTARVFLPEDVDPRALTGELPETERINSRIWAEPWFKHYREEEIKPYAEAVRKVLENYEELLPGDQKQAEESGWALTRRKD
ncbi:MAG: DegT/DnrJ/EryC1/StrS family aminotransferase [Lentisphaeria bacterium]|nr:DegT/DnrJ/EryC1/StrS family aminotransferase [Lentisphaeria bacterium]